MIDKWTAPYQRYLQPRGDPSPQPLSASPIGRRFDARGVETGLWQGYLGTTRRKGRKQTNQTYCYRATSRLYRKHILCGLRKQSLEFAVSMVFATDRYGREQTFMHITLSDYFCGTQLPVGS